MNAPDSAPEPVTASRHTQPALFSLPGPLTAMLGADFFRTLPASPGVYRFYGEEDRLLYIGQSSNLRARVGSYRFVSAASHSRRLVRMVARARRVEWEHCATAADAISLEARLLLEHRPPFNRAGVWKPDPWWLRCSVEDAVLTLELCQETPDAADAQAVAGPFHGGFRYAFGSLVRLLHLHFHPDLAWWDLPCGLVSPRVAPHQQLALPPAFSDAADSARITECVRQFATTGCPVFLEQLIAPLAALDAESAAGMFWLADADALGKFALKQAQASPVPDAESEKAEPVVQVPPSQNESEIRAAGQA